MPEPLHNQIADEIEAQLAAIVGDEGVNYWYTPDLAFRHHTFSDEVLDASRGKIIYSLYPVDEDSIEVAGKGHVAETLRLDLNVAQVYDKPDGPFATTTPKRWIVQARMLADVKKKLRTAFLAGAFKSLGVTNLEVQLADYDAESTYVAGWVLGWAHLVVRYDHLAEVL